MPKLPLTYPSPLPLTQASRCLRGPKCVVSYLPFLLSQPLKDPASLMTIKGKPSEQMVLINFSKSLTHPGDKPPYDFPLPYF